MELAVYNIKGEDTGRKVTLSDEVFGIDVNEHAVGARCKAISCKPASRHSQVKGT